MSHRFGPFAAACAAATLALPAAAGAQRYGLTAPVPVPADAPAVTTTSAGTVVLGFVHGRRLCFAIQPAGEPRPTVLPADDYSSGTDSGPAGACATPPPLTPFATQSYGDFRTGVSRAVMVGVAGVDTAAVELRHDGATVGHGATVASPLPGAAAEPRLFAIEHPIGATAEELASLDAAGMVRRAYGPDTHGSRYLTDERYLIGGHPSGPIVLRGRSAATPWRLRRSTHRVLASTPLEPERRVTQACVTLDWGTGLASESDSLCDADEVRAKPLVVRPGNSCDRPGSSVGNYVVVLARPGVRRAAVVLGDGRRVTLPLRALPGTPATPRAGAIVFGKRTGARRVLALDARGRVVDAEPLRMPPAAATGESCASAAFLLFSDDDSGGPADDKTPLRSAAPHAPHVVDAGVPICLAVDRAPRVPTDCAMPPVLPQDAILTSHPTATGRYVFAVVSAEVASARLRLDGGATRDVPTVPVPGYTGQYVDALRAIAVDVPGRHAVVGTELRDARGRVLGRGDGPEVTPPSRTDRLLPASDGVPALWSARWSDPEGSLTCLGFGAFTAFSACETVHLSGPYGLANVFEVDVRCAPRRTVVLAILRRPSDRLAVVTAAGRRVAARRVAIPGGNGLTAARVVLGPDERLRRVVQRTGHADVTPPAAARQCGFGWIDSTDPESPF